MDNDRASQSPKKRKNHSEIGQNEDERDGRKRNREEKEQDNNVKEDGTLKAAKRILGDEGSEAEPINLDSCSSHPTVEEEIGNSKQPLSEEKENGEPISLHSDNLTDFKPKGPNFRVELKSSNISSYLNIPKSFSRQYIKEIPERQKIKVDMPNKEVCELGVFAGARMTRGWRNLVKEYRLQEGDICIFELIQPTHHELVFHLYVFRRDAQNNFIRIP